MTAYRNYQFNKSSFASLLTLLSVEEFSQFTTFVRTSLEAFFPDIAAEQEGIIRLLDHVAPYHPQQFKSCDELSEKIVSEILQEVRDPGGTASGVSKNQQFYRKVRQLGELAVERFILCKQMGKVHFSLAGETVLIQALRERMVQYPEAAAQFNQRTQAWNSQQFQKKANKRQKWVGLEPSCQLTPRPMYWAYRIKREELTHVRIHANQARKGTDLQAEALELLEAFYQDEKHTLYAGMVNDKTTYDVQFDPTKHKVEERPTSPIAAAYYDVTQLRYNSQAANSIELGKNISEYWERLAHQPMIPDYHLRQIFILLTNAQLKRIRAAAADSDLLASRAAFADWMNRGLESVLSRPLRDRRKTNTQHFLLVDGYFQIELLRLYVTTLIECYDLSKTPGEKAHYAHQIDQAITNCKPFVKERDIHWLFYFDARRQLILLLSAPQNGHLAEIGAAIESSILAFSQKISPNRRESDAYHLMVLEIMAAYAFSGKYYKLLEDAIHNLEEKARRDTQRKRINRSKTQKPMKARSLLSQAKYNSYKEFWLLVRELDKLRNRRLFYPDSVLKSDGLQLLDKIQSSRATEKPWLLSKINELNVS